MFRNVTVLAITFLVLTSIDPVRARAIQGQQSQPKDVIASSTTVSPRQATSGHPETWHALGREGWFTPAALAQKIIGGEG